MFLRLRFPQKKKTSFDVVFELNIIKNMCVIGIYFNGRKHLIGFFNGSIGKPIHISKLYLLMLYKYYLYVFNCPRFVKIVY